MSEKKIRPGDPANLEIGIWTYAEIAAWFNIEKSTFSSHREKWLAKLAKYCEFEEGGKGRIWITKIF